MPHPFITLLGKSVRVAARLRGGGSALPGLFVEHISPDYVAETLKTVTKGVVVISGTNGKTTTTKMVVELLEGQGLKVFTNRTGSNFTRGIAAALLADVDLRGRLHADVAVLELDEAHAVHFVERIAPRYSLLLNVMRDQLDRFGEIDTTARLLQTIAERTTGAVVLNREDPRIARIARHLDNQRQVYFGLDQALLAQFPTDDEMHGAAGEKSKPTNDADVILKDIKGHIASFQIGDEEITTSLKLTGIYNIYNAAAALALARTILGSKVDQEKLIASLAAVEPAFGRGEVLDVDGQPLELVLVKNPSGFRLGLESFDPSGYATMIAINDNYADGRDMSWLWDVDFSSLAQTGVAQVSGVRAYDMALRLHYDEVPFQQIEPGLGLALHLFIDANKNMPKRIYCTYTAMLALRKELAKITDVEVIS